MADENRLKEAAALIGNHDLARWEDLPDLGLYMDQVTGFLNKQLDPFSSEGGEGPLTASMINNYVKSGHISRPHKKKYSREQIAALYMLCSLKKDLSINDAAALIYFLTEQNGSRAAFDHFVALQRETMDKVSARFADLHDESDSAALTALAADLILHACAERVAAESLISYLITKDDAKLQRAREAAEEERLAREQADRDEKEAREKKKKEKKAAREATKKG